MNTLLIAINTFGNFTLIVLAGAFLVAFGSMVYRYLTAPIPSVPLDLECTDWAISFGNDIAVPASHPEFTLDQGASVHKAYLAHLLWNTEHSDSTRVGYALN